MQRLQRESVVLAELTASPLPHAQVCDVFVEVLGRSRLSITFFVLAVSAALHWGPGPNAPLVPLWLCHRTLKVWRL